MPRGLRAIALALAYVLAFPAVAVEAGRERAPARSGGKSSKAKAKKGRPAPKPPKPAARGSRLERARAQLATVKRDPQKRKYRHHWEKAIRALTAAAKGKDAAPALLDAGRARYALYRFSQVEEDRDEALKLAERARKAGSREAAAFAAAVRREAGDDEPRPARRAPARVARAAPRPAHGRAAAPPPAAEPEAAAGGDEAEDADEDADEEDGSLDAALGKALAAGEDDAARPAPRPFEARPAEAGEAGEGSADEPARVSEVRTWSNAGYTRVAVYLSRPARFTQRELPAEAGHPRRLALDIHGAVLEGAAAAHPVGDAQVEQVRTAQNDPETVRVVLDLHGERELQALALGDPPRILVDVGAPPGLARAPGAPAGASELAPRRPIRRIIVDAGHGGHDSGAIGPTRVREKDVTLAMARKLEQKLKAQGFEVLLTRRDDRYLRLEERTFYANAHQGDLFVSLHANAHPRRDRRGVETYVLNVADDRYARRLAARENGALSDEAGEGAEVKHILADLDAQSSADPSRRLARLVQRELVTGIRQKAGEARDLGVKSALFYVLLGARMPAVLVETSFISNRAEEKRLKDPRFQEAVATSVARAVASFARGEARVAAR